MPPLIRPEKNQTCALPARTATEGGRADVLVVGGGPAGLGAALGAARAGAKAILVERYGFLGGNAANALVMPFAIYHTCRRIPRKEGTDRLFPTDHDCGRPVIGGAWGELADALIRGGGALPPSPETGFTLPFDPETLKLAAIDLLEEAGVGYLLHSFATGVLMDGGRVAGVVFETKSGPVVIRADAFVDCTGDGDIAAFAGAPFEVGRQTDGYVQPMSLLFIMAEFEHRTFSEYVQRHPREWTGVHGLGDLIGKAAAAGDLDIPREDILMFGTPRDREVSINSTRVVKASGLDVWDLTAAERQGRKQMAQITDFFKKYVPGFERSYIGESGAQIGVRETRRITGRYVLTGKDILGARKFGDVIAHGTYPIDIHNPTGKGTELIPVPDDDFYDIPLRCLIPLRPDNLLTAGRCISGTHEAASSYRIMAISMATGQAAGVCSAFAALDRLPAAAIPFDRVQRELLRQDAVLEINPSRA